MWGVLGINKAFLRGILGDHIENTLVNHNWVGARPKNSIIRGHVVVEAVVDLKTC